MKIHVSELAAFKIRRLLEYLENEWSREARNNFRKQLMSSIDILRQSPFAFPKSEFHPEVRKPVVSKQSTVFYKVSGDIVFIITIFDNRQDPDQMESELLKYFP